MKTAFLYVDGDGCLRIPPEIAAELGIGPGSRLKVGRIDDRLVVHRPVSSVARVYVEPTTRCNLRCETCMRNAWDEPVGDMDGKTFDRVLESLRVLSRGSPDGGGRPPVTLFFGGLGEPLVHPEIIGMAKAAKESGARVELITNGFLLDEEKSHAFIEAGLDALWVSLDGATPECYGGVRTGGSLPRVMDNLKELKDLKISKGAENPRIGVAFVAMKKTLAELPEVLRLGYRVGARTFVVSNVYPHTPELLEQILYRRSLGTPVESRSTVKMPRVDMNPDTARVMETLIDGYYGAKLEGLELIWPSDSCPFVARGSVCVRRDGKVSPCIPLLHTHRSYLGDRLRLSRAYTVGSILERGLTELWNDPDYAALRRRLEEFDFSPCSACNSCEFADENARDCFGNEIPACGGCLWAQGFIQCP